VNCLNDYKIYPQKNIPQKNVPRKTHKQGRLRALLAVVCSFFYSYWKALLAITREPEATTREPEATTREPEATTREPEATTREPEARSHAHVRITWLGMRR
jgi:hypothetical protein